MNEPTFPPLLSGLAASGDPFDAAIAQAALGCDAGLVIYNLAADALRAAIVFAPEVPLDDAIAMLPACGIGFQNALGALAPPEVAVHLHWHGGIRVNGATCGRCRRRGPAGKLGASHIGLDQPLVRRRRRAASCGVARAGARDRCRHSTG